MKIEKLTQKQEELIELHKEKWINKLNTLKFDEKKAIEGINWLYSISKLSEPKIIFCESPIECQRVANELNNTENNFYNFSTYGNIGDYGWVSFYSYFKKIGVLDFELFDNFVNLLESGIYDMIQFDTTCIVSKLPISIIKNIEGNLHSENSPAIKWNDGFSLYFWNGICVPKNWIMDKNSVTKDVIVNEKNAEKRRCLQEILGTKRFTDLLEVEVIDTDIDQKGYPMNLYRTKEIDDVINDYIYYLNVICPSTEREYYICVPKASNVWEAKAWTFKNEKIELRHGDVGLVNLTNLHEKPIFES